MLARHLFDLHDPERQPQGLLLDLLRIRAGLESGSRSLDIVGWSGKPTSTYDPSVWTTRLGLQVLR